MTSPFTLAAFATSAVSGLEAHAVRTHTAHEHGLFTSAVIATTDGEVIVRVPNSDEAEVRQSGEILGQAALTEGARAQLPFAVPETLGMTRAGDTRAVVSTFLPGAKVHVSELSEDALLLSSIAATLSAIHDLPPSVVQNGGLPVRSAEACRIETARVVDRAAQTRLLPERVKNRWIEVLQEKSLWDFAPTVVHGSVSDDVLLVEDDVVTGVLGFERLSVGDPALDLAWIFAAGDRVASETLSLYADLADTTEYPLGVRARLLHELEIARWLLHGTERHDNGIVQDATEMLDRLLDEPPLLRNDPEPVMSANDVASLLDETPEITRMRSDTEAYDGWDDERVFESEPEFADDPSDPPAQEGEGVDPADPTPPDSPVSAEDAETSGDSSPSSGEAAR